MLIQIAQLMSPAQVRQMRQALLQANWTDGRRTAGGIAVKAKQNQQLAEGDSLADGLAKLLLEALHSEPRFTAAALPLRVVPPRFNRYEGGGQYGGHVDSAVLGVPGSPQRVRTDISATLFLSEPGDYDGGELVIEDTFGAQPVKLPAGSLLLYPGTSVHRVMPVTRGVRLAAFFWIQSLVRDDGQRRLLYELDSSIQSLAGAQPERPEIPRLLGVYHNLLRRWSET